MRLEQLRTAVEMGWAFDLDSTGVRELQGDIDEAIQNARQEGEMIDKRALDAAIARVAELLDDNVARGEAVAKAWLERDAANARAEAAERELIELKEAWAESDAGNMVDRLERAESESASLRAEVAAQELRLDGMQRAHNELNAQVHSHPAQLVPHMLMRLNSVTLMVDRHEVELALSRAYCTNSKAAEAKRAEPAGLSGSYAATFGSIQPDKLSDD